MRTTTTLPARGAAPLAARSAEWSPGAAFTAVNVAARPQMATDSVKNARTPKTFERFTFTLRFMNDATSVPRCLLTSEEHVSLSPNPRASLCYEVRAFMKRWPAFFVEPPSRDATGNPYPVLGSAPLVSHANGVSGGKIQHVILHHSREPQFRDLFQVIPEPIRSRAAKTRRDRPLRCSR